MSEIDVFKHLQKGNREVITDYYVPEDIVGENTLLKFKVFVRLNAIERTFRNVSFLHCVFDGCYLKDCVFDSCDFTGCRFVSSNFHQSAFRGCDFIFASFEGCQIDDDILLSEAPRQENLRMHFARSLRTNYQQIGNAKAANIAINVELGATSKYLYKSWSSKETYYKNKYAGPLIKSIQFLKWVMFWILDFIWGNGESALKFTRTIVLIFVLISFYDTYFNGNPLVISEYWANFLKAPSIFFGVSSPGTFSKGVLSLINASQFISIGLLTTLLVKRFSRR